MHKAAAKKKAVKPHQVREYIQHLEAISDVSDVIIEDQKKYIAQKAVDNDTNQAYWKGKIKTLEDGNRALESILGGTKIELARANTKTQRVVEERDRLQRLVEMFLSVSISPLKLEGNNSVRDLRDQHFVTPRG